MIHFTQIQSQYLLLKMIAAIQVQKINYFGSTFADKF